MKKLAEYNSWSFDIDGTITDYPNVWLEFLSIRLNRKFASIAEAKNLLGNKYNLLKDEYRKSDYKYSVHIDDGALKVLNFLNKRKDNVYFCTSRPLAKYVDMKTKTGDWLSRNEIDFVDIIQKENFNTLPVDAHIDDSIDHILYLKKKKNIPFILIGDFVEESGVSCFSSMEEFYKELQCL